MLRRVLALFIVFALPLVALVEPVTTEMRVRQPTWRTRIVENYPGSNAKRAGFYELQEDGRELPVKEICFYPEGGIETESDLLPVAEDAFIRHGVSVTNYPSGKTRAVCFYDRGKLHGPVQEFHENGQVAKTYEAEQGKIIGIIEAFDDQGVKIASTPYKEGVPHGLELQWYSSGQVKARCFYKKGLLHGDDERRAVTVFYETGDIQEQQNFSKGEPIGAHLKFWANGQEAYRLGYQNGKKQGAERFFFDDGSLRGEGRYEKGKPVGRHWIKHTKEVMAREAHFDGARTDVKESYEDGTPRRAFCQFGDHFEGEYREWHPTGELACLYQYDKGTFEGEQKEYYDNGQAKARSLFHKGMRDGLFEEWHPNGTRSVEASYVEGELHGPQRMWHPSGQLKMEVEFVHGLKQGPEMHYFADGSVECKATYVDDKLDGDLVAYFEDGSIHLTQSYDRGVPVGIHREYYPKQDGHSQLARLVGYEGGNLHGQQEALWPDGTMQAVIGYRNGQLHGLKATYDQEGNLLEECWYDNGNLDGRMFVRQQDGSEMVAHYKNHRREGPHTLFYPEHEEYGRVKAYEANYVNDKIEGEAVEFSPAGIKLASTFHRGGKRHGTASLYNEDGVLMMTMEFKDDLKDGPSIQFFPNGKVMRKAFYVRDKKEGREESFFVSGRTSSLYFYEEDQLNGVCKEWNDRQTLVFEAEYKAGLRDGIFNKYYEDGSPRVMQTYVKDQLDGFKRVYDRDGTVIEMEYAMGRRLDG